jgi:hypothetical protein
VLTSSALSYSDTATDLQKNCESTLALNAKGEGGSCRVVVAVKNEEKSGICEGIISNKLKCEVRYLSTSEGSGLNLFCGERQAPVINQDFTAEILSFNNIAITKDSKEKETIINDPINYTLISSRMIELSLQENANQKITGTITIILEKGIVPLTNVVCY